MIKTAVTLAIVLLLGFVLNPSPDAHREKLKREIAERSQIAGALGIGSLAAFASSYQTLGIASYLKVNDRVVTVGAFGVVFVPNLTSR